MLYKYFYLCNGKKPECKDHINCYKNGGECKYTEFLQYARPKRGRRKFKKEHGAYFEKGKLC